MEGLYLYGRIHGRNGRNSYKSRDTLKTLMFCHGLSSISAWKKHGRNCHKLAVFPATMPNAFLWLRYRIIDRTGYSRRVCTPVIASSG